MSASVDEYVLTFPDGIPGFPAAHRWMLSDLVEDRVFQVLASLDEPGLEMVVGVPWLFFPDYAPDLTETDRADLGIETVEDAVVFCSVTVPEGGGAPTMNLLGPFIVNRHTRVGRQVVLEADAEQVRTPLPLGA
jgi:flagellar assembly factor FliW